MPGVSTLDGSPLKLIDSRDTLFFAALVANDTAVPNRVTPITLTLGAAFPAAAAGTASTLTPSAAPDIPIRVGTVIQFNDAAGSYLGKVTAESADGLNLEMTATENIPNGAVANWPPEIDLVESHSVPLQTTINNTSTYQHKGAGEPSRGDTTRTLQMTARKSFYAAGQGLLDYAIENEQDIYFEIHDPNPDASTYTTNPPIRFGTGKLSDGSETGNNGDKLQRTFNLTVSGRFGVVEPA